MSSLGRSSLRDGFTYVEALMALTIVALMFRPAYDVSRRLLSAVTPEVPAALARDRALDQIADDVRRAVAFDETPFVLRGDLSRMSFALASRSGPRPCSYELTEAGEARTLERNDRTLATGVRTFALRAFDGSAWQGSWGWNAERDRPAEGVRGAPLAIEVTLEIAGAPARARRVPVMASLVNRWTR